VSINLEVIGAGFGRTGTMSLKVALEELGFGPCYHMREVFEHHEVTAAPVPEGRYNPVAATECAEWIFTTAQPDVLIAPWLIADVSCDRSFEPIVNAWRAAEILLRGRTWRP
jgi:hypothetical protein